MAGAPPPGQPVTYDPLLTEQEMDAFQSPLRAYLNRLNTRDNRFYRKEKVAYRKHLPLIGLNVPRPFPLLEPGLYRLSIAYLLIFTQ